MSFSLSVYLEGLGTGAGLIIAIGAQNAFVLRQGIVKQHVFPVALCCTLIDLLLISAGVAGLGTIIGSSTVFLAIAGIGGSVFLGWYAIRSLCAAVHPGELVPENKPGNSPGSLRATLTTILALSLLNPHVYLDTVVLLGSIGGRHPPAFRPSFVLGATCASALWFFGLAFGAGFLAPLFKKPVTWRVLDILVGLTMAVIAVSLIFWVVGALR